MAEKLSNIRSDILKSIQKAGIGFKESDGPLVEYTTSPEGTTARFTIVLSGVMMKRFPEIRSAEIRVHYESGPLEGSWKYIVIDSFDFPNTMSQSKIEAVKSRFQNWISAFFDRLATQFFKSIEEGVK